MTSKLEKWKFRLYALLVFLGLCIGFTGGVFPILQYRTAFNSVTENATSLHLIERDGNWLTKLLWGSEILVEARLEDVEEDDLRYLLELDTIERLELWGSGVTDESIQYLEALDQLESLGINSTRISGAGLGRLSQSLRRLQIYNSPIEDRGIQSICQLKQLTHLEIMSRSLTDEGCQHLDLLTELEVLSIYGSPLTDQVMPSIGSLKKLTFFTLSDARITDAGLRHLHPLPVEVLDLWDCPSVTGSGLGGMHTLRRLNLSGSAVNDEATHAFESLKQVEFLYLDGTQITDAAAESICRLPNLLYLNIARTQVGDQGLKHLSQKSTIKLIECEGLKIGQQTKQEIDNSRFAFDETGELATD